MQKKLFTMDFTQGQAPRQEQKKRNIIFIEAENAKRGFVSKSDLPRISINNSTGMINQAALDLLNLEVGGQIAFAKDGDIEGLFFVCNATGSSLKGTTIIKNAKFKHNNAFQFSASSFVKNNMGTGLYDIKFNREAVGSIVLFPLKRVGDVRKQK